MKTVTGPSPARHEQKSRIVAGATLIRLTARFSNQIRGLLKPLGLILGKVPRGRLEQRVREPAADRPELMAALEPLLTLRREAIEEFRKLDDHLLARAKSGTVVRRLMTIPGIGATTALTFKAVIDDPGRFRKSPEVGAYLGLVPRRWQSGKVDQTGRITHLWGAGSPQPRWLGLCARAQGLPGRTIRRLPPRAALVRGPRAGLPPT